MCVRSIRLRENTFLDSPSGPAKAPNALAHPRERPVARPSPTRLYPNDPRKVDLSLVELTSEGSLVAYGLHGGAPKLWLLSVTGHVLRCVALSEFLSVLKFVAVQSLAALANPVSCGYVVTAGTQLEVAFRDAHSLARVQTFFVDGHGGTLEANGQLLPYTRTYEAPELKDGGNRGGGVKDSGSPVLVPSAPHNSQSLDPEPVLAEFAREPGLANGAKEAMLEAPQSRSPAAGASGAGSLLLPAVNNSLGSPDPDPASPRRSIELPNPSDFISIPPSPATEAAVANDPSQEAGASLQVPRPSADRASCLALYADKSGHKGG